MGSPSDAVRTGAEPADASDPVLLARQLALVPDDARARGGVAPETPEGRAR
ncbi:hypothetical protein [Streptomyces sp. NPDC002889]|uniref:hypothetical protein n=1 Tax=Streptomyces sp. NPDC002889 TaxID=3364669 RepID=UPI0036941234